MRLAVAETPEANWAQQVQRFGATLHHSPAWLAASARFNSSPRFFTWFDANGEPVAIAAGTLRRSSLPLVGRWSSSLTLDSVPAVLPEFLPHGTPIIDALKQYALGVGCKTLNIESHMAAPLLVDARLLAGVARGRIEFRVDLGKTEEQLWQGLHSHHRRKIKKAMKQGLSIRESTAAHDASALRDLQRGSQDRRRKRGENMKLGDDEPIIALMKNMLRDGIGRLFLAEHDGRIVSGAFMSTFDSRAYYVFGGSNPDGFRLDAPGLLFWHMIRVFRDAGFVEFNLGGVPVAGAREDAAEHGLYRFKAGFGGREVECFDYSFDLRPRLSAAVGLVTRLLRSARG